MRRPAVEVRRAVLMTACASMCLVSCAPPSAPVDEMFAHFESDGSPGAAVMVIRDGEVVHAAGYGLADLGTGVPLTPSTPVRLGSVSKAFTAMAVVILEERGLVRFDAPVADWIPELSRFPDVTVRHLLNHTSGLPDYYGEGSPLAEIATAEGRDAPFQNAEAASLYETWGEPRFAPGERFEYSNPGYELLALMVERVSGSTFAEFLEAEIFSPLEMETAKVRDLPSTVIPQRAVGYTQDEDSGAWRENDDHWGNWMVGAGGVYASIRDMYLWDQALEAWAESGDRLTESFASAVLNDGSTSEYGFGWSLSDRLGRSAIHHGGGWVGFRTAFFRFPDDRLSVVVLSNATAAADELATAVSQLYLDE